MFKNMSIKCEVEKCTHHADGGYCSLDGIKVGCCCCDDNGKCTCCEDYCEK